MSSGHVSVVVEKSEKSVLELREFLLTRETCIVLNVIVKQMDGFGLEESSYFCVFMDDITQMYLVNVRVESAVSDSGPEKQPGQDSESLEAVCEVPELIEEDRQGR